MVVRNTDKDTQIASDCRTANTFASRFMGLMGRKSLGSGSGLLIKPCNSIHMFFMRFPIDVVFLDKNGVVVYIAEGIKPWRISRIVPKAHSVLELPTGTVRASRTGIGDNVAFK